MSTFKIYDINIIDELSTNLSNYKTYYINCEILKEGDEGGEAFSLNVIETDDKTKLNNIEQGCLFIDKFQKEKVISTLQSFIDKCGATSWNDLSSYVEKYFLWI